VAKVDLTTESSMAYDHIKDALRRLGARVFESRPNYIELTARVGTLELTKQVLVDSDPYVESSEPRACFIPFRLRAAEGDVWYPVFDGALIAVPGPYGTTIAMQGSYRPPIGIPGEVADAAVLHYLAEQSLTSLLMRAASALRDAASGTRDLIGHPYS
jgi:hypothetical protein